MRSQTPDSRQIWFWLVAAIAVTSFFTFLFTPFNGDDWAYKMAFEGPDAKMDSWLSYPRWCGSHWLTTNGRIGNYLAPALMAATPFIRAVLCALAIWLMYWSSVILSGVRKGFLPILLIAMAALGLPWWDAMYIFDCQLNYIWTTALVTSAFIVILNSHITKNSSLIFAFLLCGAAGISHEAASAPLIAAFVIWSLYNRSWPEKNQLILLAAFLTGTILVLFAPGIILRNSADHTPDDQLLPLLLKSDPAAILLWLTITALATFRTGREAVYKLMRSNTGIFALASLFSAIISAYSGIVGRTGWFAEIYAFIAITGWLHMYCRPKWTVASLILSAIITAQGTACAVLQYDLQKESDEFERQYIESDNGLIFIDCTRDNDIPWWTLGRLRGVPDADDAFNLFAFARYHGRSGQWPVIMPIEARNHIPLKAGSNYVLGNGDILTTQLPDTRTALSFEGHPVKTTIINSRIMTVQEVPGGYYLAPLITDPGDRYDIEL